MINFFKTVLSLILLFNVAASSAYAQDKGDVDELVSESKNDLLVVVSGGLAGAILGLSTLSFVEEPKEHTRNILVGASVGIIAGVGYVAFSQANKSRDMMYGPPPEDAYKAGQDFGTYARVDWHHEEFGKKSRVILAPLNVGYSFNY
ncbi:MAG: hypothetical protein WD025_05115 [Bacteriovoracaceae bacterium]